MPASLHISDIAIVVLASGLSKRFGQANKLLAPSQGKPLAAFTAEIALPSPAYAKIAVTDLAAPEVTGLYKDHGWDVIENKNPTLGLSHSLKLAVKKVRASKARALCVCLADMPHVDGGLIVQLIQSIGTADAIMCEAEGVNSPPVILRGAFLPLLLELEGDIGAKSILANMENVAMLKVHEALIMDMDTPKDFAVHRVH